VNQRKTLSWQRKSPKKCHGRKIQRWRCARQRLFRKTTIAGEISSESCVAVELRQKSFFVFDLGAAFTAQIDVQPRPFFLLFSFFLLSQNRNCLGWALALEARRSLCPGESSGLRVAGVALDTRPSPRWGERLIERREPREPSERSGR
jgi:hypothetical protein